MDTLTLSTLNFENQFPKNGYPRSRKDDGSLTKRFLQLEPPNIDNFSEVMITMLHSNQKICGNSFRISCFFVPLHTFPLV